MNIVYKIVVIVSLPCLLNACAYEPNTGHYFDTSTGFYDRSMGFFKKPPAPPCQSDDKNGPYYQSSCPVDTRF
jgi:hypothetical protein